MFRGNFKHKLVSQFSTMLAPFVLKPRQPLITFIVPIYNKIQFMDECIQSILDQDVKSPVEIICVDDASNDGSYERILTFAKDPRFIIAQNDCNLGPGPTRNRGIRLASAKYLRFVDADDVLPKEILPHQLLMAAERFGVPLVRGNVERLDRPSTLLSPVSDTYSVMFFDHERTCESRGIFFPI